MPEPTVTVLAPRGVLDVDGGELLDGAYVRVEGNRITSVDTDRSVTSDQGGSTIDKDTHDTTETNEDPTMSRSASEFVHHPPTASASI